MTSETDTVGEITIDPTARRCFLNGVEVALSGKEFGLLWYLVENHGRVITRDEIMEHVWEMAWHGSTKTLDMHICWLRRKLGDNAVDSSYITTIRGIGFRWDGPPMRKPIDPGEQAQQIADGIRQLGLRYPADVFPPNSNGGAMRYAFEEAARFAESFRPPVPTCPPTSNVDRGGKTR
jgi:DNA-binding winged helix-turn-helix (wHTH) protein